MMIWSFVNHHNRQIEILQKPFSASNLSRARQRPLRAGSPERSDRGGAALRTDPSPAVRRDCIKGRDLFCDYAEAEGVPGSPGYHTIDEETFARNWRPPSMSELLESLLADERRRRGDPKPPRPSV
jgi:hypothetical protein